MLASVHFPGPGDAQASRGTALGAAGTLGPALSVRNAVMPAQSRRRGRRSCPPQPRHRAGRSEIKAQKLCLRAAAHIPKSRNETTGLPESRAVIPSYWAPAPGAAAVQPKRGRVVWLSRGEPPGAPGLCEPVPGWVRATAQLRRSNRDRRHRRSTSPAT